MLNSRCINLYIVDRYPDFTVEARKQQKGQKNILKHLSNAWETIRSDYDKNNKKLNASLGNYKKFQKIR